jgi:hypothetical protein
VPPSPRRRPSLYTIVYTAAGLHRTMEKVCKSDCEGTVAETRGNGEVAPIPAVGGSAIEPRDLTRISRSQLRFCFKPRQAGSVLIRAR